MPSGMQLLSPRRVGGAGRSLQVLENMLSVLSLGWHPMCRQCRRSRVCLGSGDLMSRTWPAMFLCLTCVVSVAAGTRGTTLPSAGLEKRERQFTKSLVRASQFVDVRHISSLPSCENVEPPEALTTPDPLFTTSAYGRKVKVSFIIGADGRVHSPLILESAGVAGDRRVLQTVRTWRYRPATCNGVATETEGKVEFSSR